MTTLDRPEGHARTTVAADGAEVVVRANELRAYLGVYGSGNTVQAGVCLTRGELVAHRDACNAVLIATEPA